MKHFQEAFSPHFVLHNGQIDYGKGSRFRTEFFSNCCVCKCFLKLGLNPIAFAMNRDKNWKLWLYDFIISVVWNSRRTMFQLQTKFTVLNYYFLHYTEVLVESTIRNIFLKFFFQLQIISFIHILFKISIPYQIYEMKRKFHYKQEKKESWIIHSEHVVFQFTRTTENNGWSRLAEYNIKCKIFSESGDIFPETKDYSLRKSRFQYFIHSKALWKIRACLA